MTDSIEDYVDVPIPIGDVYRRLELRVAYVVPRQLPAAKAVVLDRARPDKFFPNQVLTSSFRGVGRYR